MNSKHQIFFAQRFSLLLNSGVSIIEALSIMKNIESSKKIKKIYQKLIDDIEQGVSLSKSIRNNKFRFNNLLLTLIQNGESSGHLSEALLHAYNYMEKRSEMKKKIVGSLIYPIFIIVATIGMTIFLVMYIFPKIIPLLKSLDIELPLITRVVQWIYYSSISYGIGFICAIFIFVVIFHLLVKKVYYLRYRFHFLLLSIPIASSYLKIYLMSSICSIGDMLLSSGKDLPNLLSFSKDSSRNLIFRKAFAEIYEESIQGISLSASVKKHGKLFPPIFSDMCALGERTGSLSAMLGHCARIFEQDIDNFLKRFSSLVEPLIMIFMGLIVGSIALSIILPVYEITNHLSK